MSEQSWQQCLELLGLEPGASAHEIKAAYRDMAKVWHPDRFTHDPRLQQKAQEKLKEINDAYQQLLAGGTSARPQRPACDTQHNTTRAQRAHATHEETPHAQRGDAPTRARRKVGWLALAPIVVFCATFAFVTPRLLRSRHAPPSAVENSAAAEPSREQPTEDVDEGQKNSRKQKPSDGATRADSSASADKLAQAAATPPVRALPTVSVSIDPMTSLRARADCPNKMTVTFPAGDEPHAYCTAEHRRSEQSATTTVEKHDDKSRLKSFAGRLASPSKWLSDKPSSNDPAKKLMAQDQSRVQN